MLSTKLILTLEAVKELTTTKEATQKAKEQAIIIKKQFKKDCQAVVELTKEQVKV